MRHTLPRMMYISSGLVWWFMMEPCIMMRIQEEVGKHRREQDEASSWVKLLDHWGKVRLQCEWMKLSYSNQFYTNNWFFWGRREWEHQTVTGPALGQVHGQDNHITFLCRKMCVGVHIALSSHRLGGWMVCNLHWQRLCSRVGHMQTPNGKIQCTQTWEGN